MAVRDRGAVRIPQYCAEHRHDIPGFEKAGQVFGQLHDYESFLEYEKQNLGRATKIAAGVASVAVAAYPMALMAAPAIGGIVGSFGSSTLAGAAATNYGLAMLGGGSLAAGGLGMAGGTMVIAAAGTAVGGVLGASITNAYVREDKSFRIDLLRPGAGGVPVVVANGFLTEGASEKWGGWRDLIDQRYPDSPVYRVRWGSKEMRDLGALAVNVVGKGAGRAWAKGAAAMATKAGAKALGVVAAPLALADLAKNPWHVAKSRADKTGVILGDLLARTDTESYVLVGHSLGARVMAVAAETLGTKPDGGPRIQAVHLLGAALGAQGDWDQLVAKVDEAVYNYHSQNDGVLARAYVVAQAGEGAAGRTGFKPIRPGLVNVDVSNVVKGHSEYQANITLLSPDQ